MSRAELIYPLRKTLEKELKVAGEDPHNKDILSRYYKVRSSVVALATQVIDFKRLNEMSRILGRRFEDASVKDVEDLIFTVNQRHPHPNTQNKYRKVLKKFYQWMRSLSRGEYPPEVKWIQMNRVPLVAVGPEDLLPFEECVRIGEFASNLRDKALFLGKLDAGVRIGEILTLRIGEVQFNEWGAVGYSEGKTGPGPVIFTWSAKTLALWLNQHPFRNDKNAPVFCKLGRRKPIQLAYSGARTAFGECVKKAGYSDRRVWLHLLKHVSSTNDADLGLPDSYRKFKHHWAQDSKMSRVYEHLSESVIPKIQAKTWELIAGPDKHQAQVPVSQQLPLVKRCGRCELENPRDSMFCNRCAFPLDEKKAAEIIHSSVLHRNSETEDKAERLSAELAKYPEVIDMLLRSLAALLKDESS